MSAGRTHEVHKRRRNQGGEARLFSTVEPCHNIGERGEGGAGRGILICCSPYVVQPTRNPNN